MKIILNLVLNLLFCSQVFAQTQPSPAKPPATAAQNPQVFDSVVPSPAQALANLNELLPKYRYFYGIPDVFSLNLKAVPECKKEFTKLCGEAKFPLPGKFTSCLQANYNKYKTNAACEHIGHALISNNFLLWLVLSEKSCVPHFNKCVVNLKPLTEQTFARCMATTPDLTPLCLKLIQDVSNNTYVLTLIYDHLKTSW